MATIHLKFIGFNTIKFLQSENIFVLTEALRYHKQLSTSLIAVGDIIIGKSFDKLVKAMDVKVSTKRWRDRSQTQRYGGSGTGYTLQDLLSHRDRKVQVDVAILDFNKAFDPSKHDGTRTVLFS